MAPRVTRVARLLSLIYRRQANPGDDKSGHCGKRSYREGDFQDQAHVGVAMPYRGEDEQKSGEQGHQNQKTDYSADQTDRRGQEEVAHQEFRLWAISLRTQQVEGCCPESWFSGFPLVLEIDQGRLPKKSACWLVIVEMGARLFPTCARKLNRVYYVAREILRNHRRISDTPSSSF